MDNKTMKNKLEAMEGKTFQYARQIHYVQAAVLDENSNKCIIKTNLSTYERLAENMPDFLKYWQPVQTIELPVKAADNQQLIPVYLEEENVQCNNVIASLNDAIEKVKTDKTYIPQALAVNSIAQTVILAAKAKFEIIKALNHRKLK